MSAALFLSVFSLYIAGMILLSVWISRRQRSGEDFLLGNRSVPFLLVLGTTVATMVGAGSSMGAVGKGYSAGWAGSLYGIGGAAGILLLAYLFGPARRYNFMTFSEEISFYYGANRTIKGLIAVLILLASVGWLGAHILGGGMYLAWIVGMDLLAAKLIVVFTGKMPEKEKSISYSRWGLAAITGLALIFTLYSFAKKTNHDEPSFSYPGNTRLHRHVL